MERFKNPPPLFVLLLIVNGLTNDILRYSWGKLTQDTHFLCANSLLAPSVTTRHLSSKLEGHFEQQDH